MKLTENGLNRLVENTKRCSLDGCWSVRPIGPAQVDALKSFEFDSGDFAGAVVLTVEEAKAVNEAIEWLCSTFEDYEREHDNTPALIEGWNQMDFLEHRIEQAEC